MLHLSLLRCTHGTSNRYDICCGREKAEKYNNGGRRCGHVKAAFKRYCFCLIITLILLNLPVCRRVFVFCTSFVVVVFFTLLLCAYECTDTHTYTYICMHTKLKLGFSLSLEYIHHGFNLILSIYSTMAIWEQKNKLKLVIAN